MPPDGASPLAANLASLASTNPRLAAAVSGARRSQALGARQAKDGSPVPIARGPAGDIPLHSLIDPRREADRLLQSTGATGSLVLFGLGAGYLAASFLSDPRAACLLIVEKDAATLRALLEDFPLSGVLEDPRTSLVAGAEEIRSSVGGAWLPAICGDLHSLSLRPWCELEKPFFESAAQEVRRAVEEVRADFSVQAHFGKRWFANIVMNLSAAQSSPMTAMGARRAHVTAAGPSLEAALPELFQLRKGSIIVATDTSLPALTAQGLRPDVVVSLDCQVYSYLHFFAGVPHGTTVFFDLASPPAVVRRAGPAARFFASAHPFCRYLQAAWRPFPSVDTTGGNVTHAAVSLARRVGISDIVLHGADFSYPRGKPYARGTYLFDHFMNRQLRTRPLESSLLTFVLGSPGLVSVRADSGDNGVTFSTPALRDYKTRMERFLESGNTAQALAPFPDSPARCSWQDLLAGYSEALRALSGLSAPLGASFNILPAPQKVLWTTVLPVLASVMRGSPARSPEDCLELARQWALDRVERTLHSAAHGA